MESPAPPPPKRYIRYRHTDATDQLQNICARLVEWSEIMGYSLGNRNSLGGMGQNGTPADVYNAFTSSKRLMGHDNAMHHEMKACHCGTKVYADNAGHKEGFHELKLTNQQEGRFKQEFHRNARQLVGTEDVDFRDDGNEYHDERTDITRKNAFLSSQCTLSRASVATNDRRERNVCVKCNKGGKLLACGTNSCSLVIHKSCLGCHESFGSMREFYCPFCAYFQAISKYADIKKSAYLIRKDLTNFFSKKARKEWMKMPHKSYRIKQDQKERDGLHKSRQAGYSTLSSGDNPLYRGKTSTNATPHPLHTDKKGMENTGQMSHSSRVHGQDQMAAPVIFKSQCENTSCQVPGESIGSESHAEIRSKKGILRSPDRHLPCEYNCSRHTESVDAKRRSKENSGVSKYLRRVQSTEGNSNKYPYFPIEPQKTPEDDCRTREFKEMPAIAACCSSLAEDVTAKIRNATTPQKGRLRSDSDASIGLPMHKSPRLCKQGSASSAQKIEVTEKCLKSSFNLCRLPPEKKSSEHVLEKLTWDPRDLEQLRAVYEALHVSTAPTTVLCREDEQNRILDFCKKCVEQQEAGSLYVCGCPGTGKSLSMEKVKVMLVDWANEESLQPPDILSINCSSLTNMSEIFSEILEQDHSQKKQSCSMSSLQQLHNLYSQKRPAGMKMILVIADELDYLITKDRAALHDLFMLTTMPYSRCIVLGIANAIDLPDMFIPKLQSLNCKPMVITFCAYSKDQIITILQERLRALPFTVFQPQALELCARRVAAASGDMRKALAVCRSAIELLKAEGGDPKSLSSLNRTEDQQKSVASDVMPNQINNMVRIDHVAAALSKVYESPVVDTILSLPQHQQIILCSAVKLFCGRKKDTTLDKLNKSYVDVCKSTLIPPVGIVELSSMCKVLEDQGIIKLGQSREDNLRRLTLKVDKADIVFALQGVRFFRNCLQRFC